MLNKDQYIQVKISTQKLQFLEKGELVKEYDISTSKYGIGNKVNSFKTPLGKHKILEKLGDGVPCGGIFKQKKYRGENCFELDSTDEDLITSRIFILEGLEAGKNDNSRKRAIWVHGTQQEELIGKPASHGCIRLGNEDMIELFDLVKVGTIVMIML